MNGLKFIVGLADGKDNLTDCIEKNREFISEVYFSWGDFASGRNRLAECEGRTLWEIQQGQVRTLEKLSHLGIRFNLLFNANCYGKSSQSRAFFDKVGNTADYIINNFGLSSVTTASPLIAKFFKNNFKDIEIRASVNMEVGTTVGMDYISDVFDSFYLKREYNRDLEKLKTARRWCDENGKKLYGLANSGCLNFCSTHTFHDNLVAHENEISEMDNAYQFGGQCWDYLGKEDKRSRWLQITNFIRPEDVYLYEGLFDGLKLATRTNKNPARVVDAYCSGSYSGIVGQLLEPDHSGLFYPEVIDNKKIPADFAQRVLNCNKKCGECGFCVEAQKTATVALK